MTNKELIAKIREWVLRRKYIHHNIYTSRNDDEKINLMARTRELEDEEFIYFLGTLPVEKED